MWYLSAAHPHPGQLNMASDLVMAAQHCSLDLCTHTIKCMWWYACSLVAMTLMDTSGFTQCGLRVCVLLLHPESCLWTKVPPKREWDTNLFQPRVDAAPLTWSLFVGAPRWRAASGCHHIQTLSVSLPYESVLKVETTIYSFFLSFFVVVAEVMLMWV